MAYIEENMRLRRGDDEQKEAEDGQSKPWDPNEELYRMLEQHKAQNAKKLS